MKESGVAWIGAIPQGWEVRRFKDAGSFQTGRDHKSLNEGSTPVYGSSREAFAFVDRPLCKRKAIAIGRKGTIDQPFVIQAGFWAVDTCMFNTVLKKNFSLEYLGYWAEIVPWREMSTQTALPSLTQTDANNAIVGYPPLTEQRAIADYLDRQSALIDQRLATLADKKAVLAELRKATIHEAVTKGLNKTAAMKDSGVAWIGAIPQGWEVRRFKDAGSFQTGRDHKSLNEGSTPVYGSSREAFAFVDRPLCKRKAIAIGRKGTIDQPFVIQAGFWAVDTCMFNTVLKKNFSLEYLGYWAEIVPWREMSTQTALPSLTQTDANNAIVGYPPLTEQRAIAGHLDYQTQQFDAQLATLDEQARVLKELRKAIIHEAVTGKIDLSGYTPQTPEALVA